MGRGRGGKATTPVALGREKNEGSESRLCRTYLSRFSKHPRMSSGQGTAGARARAPNSGQESGKGGRARR